VRDMASSMTLIRLPCLLARKVSGILHDYLLIFSKDYRIPQMLHTVGVMWYCPPLENKLRRLDIIESGHPWEMQIRGPSIHPLPPPSPLSRGADFHPGCSIWAVELLRREIIKLKPEAKINAILIDFFLYDLAKEKERDEADVIPHHRTRSIWY
jgi:hypothetical protein